MEVLRWSWLLLSLASSFAPASAAPGVVEVDLIFPRNTTFQPSPLTPIVFAFQNTELIRSLDNPTLSWHWGRRDGQNGSEGSGLQELSEVNFTSDPYLFSLSTSKFQVEASFEFRFEIQYSNCSKDPETGSVLLDRQDRLKGVYFTTKNGTSPPELAATTGDDTCAQWKAMAWNVTDVLDISDKPPSGYLNLPRSSCAVLPSITPTPDPSPCNVKIDPVAASSISAELTSWRCRTQETPDVSCPPKSTNAAIPGARISGRGGWVLGMAGWLAYSLV